MSPTESTQAAECFHHNATVVTTVLHEFAESLGAAVDAKDTSTRQHSEEVSLAAHALALELGMQPLEADIIHVAAHLHDVGKIGVPDAVLLKPGPLTKKEWKLMRRHTEIGAEIIRPVKNLCECGVLEMVLHHHERYDGCGYPTGLRGQDIPLGARIIAVADSISAMLQTRPYRPPMSFEEAYREILKKSGSQFDPRVVEAFDSIHAVIHEQLAAIGPGPGCSDGGITKSTGHYSEPLISFA